MKTTSLVKSFTVKLISRNISQVIQKFRKLHTMHCVRVCVEIAEFSLTCNYFVKTTEFTEFFHFQQK